MIRRAPTFVLAGLALACLSLAVTGCGDDTLAGTDTGSIHASPAQVTFSQVAVGNSAVETLEIRNTANTEELGIFDIELTAGENGHIDQLEIVDKPTVGDEIRLDGGDGIEIDIEYTPSEDAPANHGQIRVRNSDPGVEDGILEVPVNTLGNQPEFFPEPSIVRFQRMQPGESTTQELRVTNIGSGPMTIFEEPEYTGGDDFGLVPVERDFPLQLEPYSSSGASENPDDYILDLEVEYQPLGDGDESGQVLVETNAVDNFPPADGETAIHQIDVLADAEAPCIEVDGRSRDFGQVPIGEVVRESVTINNCGSETLDINGIVLEDDEEDVYDLNLGNWDQNGDGTIDDIVSLDPEESETFNVAFEPVEEGTRRADIIITSNDPIQPELTIDLVARGAEGTCPEAVATATIDGAPMQPSTSITAAPLDTVLLDGSESFDEDGDIIDWQWEVLEDPPGIDAELEYVDEDDDSRRQFDPLTAGDYRIGLTVMDDSGFQSCEQAVVDVTVIPDQNIHVELTWTNPEDPDETNEIGSDLDLHLVKMGPGEWFDLTWSVYFQHPNQEGNDIWNPEDPSLDIDVRDGAGPENITMETPDHCQWYGVGVHYYEKQFGTAYATIRIYINGDLQFVRPHFPLEETGEFWDAARIHWDSDESGATVLGVDGFYPMAPAGQEPEVTDDMIEQGLCTAENLY